MSFYSVWPPFVCMSFLFALAATPLLSFADSPPSATRTRLVSLDGLRGFLALAVVFYHAAIYYGYLTTGVWGPPPIHFYRCLGPLGVSGFFMITGYLFWARLIREGRPMEWRAFYIGRLFRISPLYLAAVCAMLVIVFSLQRFHLAVPASHLAKELLRWLSLGFLAGFTANGSGQAFILLAGVTWSIQWEWFFYLSLPVIAFAARSEKLRIPFLLLMYACCLLCSVLPLPAPWSYEYERWVALFLMGMFSASFTARRREWRLPDSVSSSLIVALVAGVFLLPDPYSFRAGLLLGCSFYLIVSGSTLFGILLSRPARRLGDISYGIYLLQGLALAAIFSPMRIRKFALAAPLHFWFCAFLASVILLMMATLAHVFVERPGIRWGRRIARHL